MSPKPKSSKGRASTGQSSRASALRRSSLPNQAGSANLSGSPSKTASPRNPGSRSRRDPPDSATPDNLTSIHPESPEKLTVKFPAPSLNSFVEQRSGRRNDQERSPTRLSSFIKSHEWEGVNNLHQCAHAMKKVIVGQEEPVHMSRVAIKCNTLLLQSTEKRLTKARSRKEDDKTIQNLEYQIVEYENTIRLNLEIIKEWEMVGSKKWNRLDRHLKAFIEELRKQESNQSLDDLKKFLAQERKDLDDRQRMVLENRRFIDQADQRIKAIENKMISLRPDDYGGNEWTLFVRQNYDQEYEIWQEENNKRNIRRDIEEYEENEMYYKKGREKFEKRSAAARRDLEVPPGNMPAPRGNLQEPQGNIRWPQCNAQSLQGSPSPPRRNPSAPRGIPAQRQEAPQLPQGSLEAMLEENLSALFRGPH